MDQKKSPNRRSKRQSKLAEDSYWDCSVCTYRNTAEAFKCLMCDVRKGTSTRKPRINPQLVAQQVAQQYTQSIPKVKKEGMVPTVKSESGMGVGSPPTISTGLKPDKKNGSATSDGKVTPITTTVIPLAVTTTPISTTTNFTAITTTATTTMTTVTPTATSRKARPKLKNVDRSSAEHKAVTVNNVTVIITEFQPKRHISSSSENNHHPQHNHHPHHHHHHHHQPPHYGPLSGGGGGGGGGCDVGIMGTSHGNMNSHPTHNGCNGASGSMSSSSGVENGNHSDSTNCSSSNDSQSEGRSS